MTVILHTGVFKINNNRKYMVHRFVLNITYHFDTNEKKSARKKRVLWVSLAGELRYLARQLRVDVVTT